MARLVASSALRYMPFAAAGSSTVSVVGVAAIRRGSAVCAQLTAEAGIVASSMKCMFLHWRLQQSSLKSSVVVRSFSTQVFGAATTSTSHWKGSEVYGTELEQVNGDSSMDFPRPSSVVWSKELANTVHFIGRLGRDMEVKHLDTGKVVAKCSLAVRKSSKKDEVPSWLEMEFWDTLAHVALQHLKKGDQVYVTGCLKVDLYVKDAVQHKIPRVVVQDLKFVEQSMYQEEGSPSWASLLPPVGTSTPQISGNYSGAKAYQDMEMVWNEYFSDPTQWWDNRGKKQNPRYPDFKHKTTNEALWVDSYKTPEWVPDQLEKLEAARKEFEASRGESAGHSQNETNMTGLKDF
ncbi:unnamed protein product [Sphagnum jensenii]|uniref:Uncharacterized protein n=1 Tax=Sphagnum jensenii TaxID=128206 RepID=A0ABP0WI90_9BRYO